MSGYCIVNGLVFHALADLASIEVQVSGTDTLLSVSVSGNDVIVQSATDSGGNATSTGLDILTAINGASTGLMAVTLDYGEDGSAVYGVLPHTHLLAAYGTDASYYVLQCQTQGTSRATYHMSGRLIADRYVPYSSTRTRFATNYIIPPEQYADSKIR